MSERTEIPLTDLLGDWPVNEVLLVCHRIHFGNTELLSRGPTVLDLGMCRCLFMLGSIPYLDGQNLRLDIQGDGQYAISEMPEERTTTEGAYLLLFTPYSQSNEEDVRARIDSAIGLLLAVVGQNVASSLVFENIIDLKTNQKSVMSPYQLNHAYLPPPRLDLLGLCGAIESFLNSQSSDDQNRIRLALRWFLHGERDVGTDSFIKLWIALETLAMASTSDIDPLVEVLSRSSGKAPEAAKKEFGVGLLFGLRSRIVHDGKRPAIPAGVLELMEAIFADVLLELSGQEPQHRAKAILDAQPGLLEHIRQLCKA